ncbi:hypothetical protein ACOSP7_013616 [Xanthoceras sorbifolium]|uniref:Uncharacterized protein n=1 Tax=Xanthoceras sorbifolium TaxID=99658 RepID=A0ABQ8I3M7_9ROSI|nr:hypothetical protein JRO89_XS04G0004000 [Xanthoceras sorbifolium]
MATDTHHTSTTDEVVEDKVNKGVKPTEKDVLSSKEREEETHKAGEKGTEEQPTAKEQSAVETLQEVQEEQPKTLEAAEKPGGPLDVLPDKEIKVEVEGIEGSEAVSEEAEKPVSDVPQVEAKFGENYQVTKKVVEKPDSVVSVVDVKLNAPPEEVEPKTSIEGGHVDDKGNIADKLDDSTPLEEGKTKTDQEETCVAADVIENMSKGAVEVREDIAKDVELEAKQDEATTDVNEPVKEPEERGLEVKGRENVETSVNELVEGKAEEVAKSDVQNQELSSKNGDEAETSQDLPKEVVTKPTQKQSNNITSKVKQSLVKAKKAIIGKSPSSY